MHDCTLNTSIISALTVEPVSVVSIAGSLTLESDDAGSGKGHNFYTSVAVRSGFPQKFEGAFVGLQTRENQNISGSDVRNTYLFTPVIKVIRVITAGNLCYTGQLE